MSGRFAKEGSGQQIDLSTLNDDQQQYAGTQLKDRRPNRIGGTSRARRWAGRIGLAVLALSVAGCSIGDALGITTAQAGSSKDATETAGGNPNATNTPDALAQEKAAEKAAVEAWMNGTDVYSSQYFHARIGSKNPTLKAGGNVEWQRNKGVPTTETDPLVIAALTDPAVIFADENDTILGFVSQTGQKAWTITATKDFVGSSLEANDLFMIQNEIGNPSLSQIVDSLQKTHLLKSTIGMYFYKTSTTKFQAYTDFMKTGQSNDYFSTSAEIAAKNFSPDYAILPLS